LTTSPLYCDNYAECNSMILARGTRPDTVNHARAKGWHIYDGVTLSGQQHHGVLCARCVDTKRRALNPAPETLPGQQQLFQIVVEVKEP
jgi:hypothetical protein